MKSNIEDITNKVAYSKIYDALNNLSYKWSYDELFNAATAFDIIDDEFYRILVSQNKWKYPLYTYASILNINKQYMSMYIFSFIISSLKDCVKFSHDIISNIISFENNTKEQNIIMLKALDKILNIYFKHKPKIKYENDEFLFAFIKENLDIYLMKNILEFSTSHNFKNVISFFNILIFENYT